MIDSTAYMNRMLTYADENILLMPTLSCDFNMLPRFIPDKKLMCYFYSDDRVSIMPLDWYLAYLHILHALHIVWYKPFSGFYFRPASEWAAVLDTYTYSREFLEYLLDDLTKEEQTEGALLVIKKLADMGKENKRFEL